MGLSTDGKHSQVSVTTWVDTNLLHHLIEACDITGHGMNGGSAEVLNELYLSERVARCCWHGESTESLRTVLESESASKHAVARRVLEDIVRTEANHPEASSHSVGPFVYVLLRVQNDGWIACSARRGVEAHTLAQGNAGHAEGVCISQVLLGGEWYLAQVFESLNVLRLETCLIKALLVEWGIHAVLDCSLKSLKLQSLYLLTRECLVLRM